MPLLKVVTNVSKDKVTKQVFDKLTDIIATELDKPRQYVLINIQPVSSWIISFVNFKADFSWFDSDWR